MQDIKEDLQKKEQLKEAAAKRKEKQDEIAAKARIKAKIEVDKEERRLRAEKEKAEREGRAPPAAPAAVQPLTSSRPVASKPASTYTESRIRFQTSGGNIQKSFPVETTLFEVASKLTEETGSEVQSFTQNYPRKVFDNVDFGATLKELGLVPSASLIVKWWHSRHFFTSGRRYFVWVVGLATARCWRISHSRCSRGLCSFSRRG